MFIKQTILSVLSQTHLNWEMLIVDDCSTDNSVAVIQKFCQLDKRIKLFILNQNSGPAIARNKAILEAKGKYIAFLDSDDLWSEKKLEKQLTFMTTSNSLLSFTSYQRINEVDSISPSIIHVPSQITYNGLLKQTVIACLSVMYDTSKIGKFYFDTSLQKHEDYQYWLEILKTIKQADGLDQSLAYYRTRNNSLSSNKLSAASYVWKIQKDYQHIPFHKRVFYFTSYAYYSTIKHLFK